jgi:DNA topoisomerase VI subunit B
MTKESSPKTHDEDTYIQETQVAYGGQEVGRRQDAEDVVVIWADSVA